MSAPEVARVLARVPATTSNLGPGFDALGMALSLYNELELEWRPGDAPAVVEIEGEGASTLPKDESNEIVRVLRECAGLWGSIRLSARNRIPIARGLGSSAAARLGALLAARASFGEVSRPEDDLILDRACALEGHPDNVVPALLGGVRLSLRDGDRLVHVKLREPKDLAVVVCVPDFELSTEKARKVLPEKVARADAVFTSARVGLLVYAFENRRWPLLKTAMQDVLHQPYRRPLVPGLRHVIEGAEAAGAYGAALSGAGPSVLAFSPPAKAQRVGRAMQKAFLKWRAESRILVLDVDTKGATAKRVE